MIQKKMFVPVIQRTSFLMMCLLISDVALAKDYFTVTNNTPYSLKLTKVVYYTSAQGGPGYCVDLHGKTWYMANNGAGVGRGQSGPNYKVGIGQSIGFACDADGSAGAGLRFDVQAHDLRSGNHDIVLVNAGFYDPSVGSADVYLGQRQPFATKKNITTQKSGNSLNINYTAPKQQ